MDEYGGRLQVNTVAEMARRAWLHAGPERAERLRNELELALEAVADLEDAIVVDSEGTVGAGPFDAGWDNARAGRNA